MSMQYQNKQKTVSIPLSSGWSKKLDMTSSVLDMRYVLLLCLCYFKNQRWRRSSFYNLIFVLMVFFFLSEIGSHCVSQAVLVVVMYSRLALRSFPPFSASQMMELQAFITMSGCFTLFCIILRCWELNLGVLRILIKCFTYFYTFTTQCGFSGIPNSRGSGVMSRLLPAHGTPILLLGCLLEP